MDKILVILASAVLAADASADLTIFDTFGPGNTYNPMLGYQIGGGGNMTEIAAQFSPAASGDLATVTLGLLFFQGSNTAFDAVDVFLYGDAGGSPDNANQTLLGSTTPVALFDGVTNNSVLSFSVPGTVSVSTGSIYYLVLKPTSLGTDDAWMRSSPVVSGVAFASHDNVTWLAGDSPILPAFRLTVASSVPDSGPTILLLVVSLAALFLLRPVFRTGESAR